MIIYTFTPPGVLKISLAGANNSVPKTGLMPCIIIVHVYTCNYSGAEKHRRPLAFPGTRQFYTPAPPHCGISQFPCHIFCVQICHPRALLCYAVNQIIIISTARTPPNSSPITVTADTSLCSSRTASNNFLVLSAPSVITCGCLLILKNFSSGFRNPLLLAASTGPISDSTSDPVAWALKEKLAPWIFSSATHFLTASSFLEVQQLVSVAIFS